MMAAVLDHLWQSTLVALCAALLTLPLRKAAAAVRYGLWFTASVKFMVPFAALAALGRLLAPALRSPSSAAPEAVFIEQAVQPLARFPFTPASSPPQVPLAQAHAVAAYAPPIAAPHLDPALILLTVWALGSAAILIVWLARGARVRAIVRSATPLDWAAPMPVLASSSLMEPGLIGLWRPVLVVPHTLPDHLGQAEIGAVLAHEASHLRRRDNLTAAMHMVVEALFWFHPMVWWIGGRLIAEREQACDEAVVRAGHDRAAYARSLVEISRFYLQSPMTCVAGASGSNLKMRVETIMTAPLSSPLSRSAKALLLAAGVCALATPVTAGLLTSPEGQQAVARATAMASSLTPLRAAAPAFGPAPAIAPASEASPVTDTAGAMPAPSDAAWLVATAALAEPAPPSAATGPSPVAPVTVQGLANPAMIEEQARNFVQGHAAVGNPEINQISRWHDAVCVEVVGLPLADQAAEIKARIEGVAQAVGLPAARAGCTANVEIVFNPEPQHVMDMVAKRREYLLGYYHFHDRNRLKTVSQPIQSWYVTSSSSFTGSATAAVTGIPLRVHGQPAHAMGIIDDPENRSPSGCADTPHFSACLTSAFENVFIVADSKVLDGRTLSQVADDMAMLALSKPRNVGGCSALPSVTDQFAGAACSGRDAADGLTAADASYLTALYASDPEAFKQFAQTDIAGRMATILIKANQTR